MSDENKLDYAPIWVLEMPLQGSPAGHFRTPEEGMQWYVDYLVKWLDGQSTTATERELWKPSIGNWSQGVDRHGHTRYAYTHPRGHDMYLRQLYYGKWVF